MEDDLRPRVEGLPGWRWTTVTQTWSYARENGDRVDVSKRQPGIWALSVNTRHGVHPTWGEAETADVPRAARALLDVLASSDGTGRTYHGYAAYLRGRAGVAQRVQLPGETYVYAEQSTYLAADGTVRHRMRTRESRKRLCNWTGGLEPVPPLGSNVARKVTFEGEPVVKLTTSGAGSEEVETAHAESLAALTEAVAVGTVQPELFALADLPKKNETTGKPIRRGYDAQSVDLRPEKRRAPRPTKAPFAGWVAWISPSTGAERRGIVTGTGKGRTVMPADGGEHLPMRSVASKVWQVKDGEADVELRAVDGPFGEQDPLFDVA
ncbi:hypothetical protein [Streptomyces sp. CB03911]|uniref:hypothetical protein n=1 Tax=Streptomyces sp. CB03911 TaxID=1804758 RepID=UPI00093F96E0|nr:hypothetical protein [Streptomyces sp. CB03911]OKI19264.1 hypothetical protein A6A07_07120 [Streptomyces sp. CB03911]